MGDASFYRHAGHLPAWASAIRHAQFLETRSWTVFLCCFWVQSGLNGVVVLNGSGSLSESELPELLEPPSSEFSFDDFDALDAPENVERDALRAARALLRVEMFAVCDLAVAFVVVNLCAMNFANIGLSCLNARGLMPFLFAMAFPTQCAVCVVVCAMKPNAALVSPMARHPIPSCVSHALSVTPRSISDNAQPIAAAKVTSNARFDSVLDRLKICCQNRLNLVSNCLSPFF
ncbi:hypothetical protein LJC31_04760 [Synergistaceae bacterium OttesenSCG-928-I11]|nr:hypothetical protein [Synergistaceae bacterium OttesenSCG-928-I11]